MSKGASGLDFRRGLLKMCAQFVCLAYDEACFSRNVPVGRLLVCRLSGGGSRCGSSSVPAGFRGSLPSLCRVLDRGPVLYRNDSSWIRKVKLTLIGQYQAAAVSPNGANKFCPSSGGHNNGWRRAYLGGDILMGTVPGACPI